MKNIVEILKSLGIEISEGKTQELNKLVSENYKTINEHNKKVSALESERDDYRAKLETANNTLKEFEGIDAEGVKKELEDYKMKLRKLEDTHKQALYDRDFDDALNNVISEIKFSSEAAKKAIMDDIKSAGLKLVDGKIMGLNDLIDTYKARDASAFVDEQTEILKQNKAKFTTPLNNNSSSRTATSLGTDQIRAAMGLKTEE